MKQSQTVPGHDGRKLVVGVSGKCFQLVGNGLFENPGMAQTDMSAAGLFAGFAGAVCLQSQIFRLGLGKTADPVVEGVVGNGTARTASETETAEPQTAFRLLHIGVLLDAAVEEGTGVVMRTGSTVKFVYGHIFCLRHMGPVFSGPVPADSQHSFQKFAGGEIGPHRNVGTLSDGVQRHIGKKKRDSPIQLLILIQLAVCVLICLFAYAVKNIGGNFYSDIRTWYYDNLNSTLVVDNDAEIDFTDILKNSTADEI